MSCLRTALVSAAMLAAALGAGTSSATEVSRGAILSAPCFACHGTNGHSKSAIPSIYGIPSESMVAKLQAFKHDRTLATVMNRHAKGYTDEEIQLIADYLSQVK